MHSAGIGLRPKGSRGALVRQFDGGWRWDDGGTFDSSEANAVIEHQRGQRPFDKTAYVSTTPHFERAKAYALHEAQDGVVYVIDRARLQEYGVKCFRVSEIVKLDIAVPDDDEHALLTDPPGAALPEAVVVEAMRVWR